MIVHAKYIGPFPEVTISGVTVKRDEVAKIRVPDGQQLGGCWELVEDGQTEAQAALEAANQFKLEDSAGSAESMANSAPDAIAAGPKKKGA